MPTWGEVCKPWFIRVIFGENEMAYLLNVQKIKRYLYQTQRYSQCVFKIFSYSFYRFS